jgi:hypothetical protein
MFVPMLSLLPARLQNTVSDNLVQKEINPVTAKKKNVLKLGSGQSLTRPRPDPGRVRLNIFSSTALRPDPNNTMG